jgi:hypothetical protein
MLSGYCATSVGMLPSSRGRVPKTTIRFFLIQFISLHLLNWQNIIALKDSAWCTAAKSLDSLRKPIGSNDAAWSVLSVLSEV